jgi:hypothetical protein
MGQPIAANFPLPLDYLLVHDAAAAGKQFVATRAPPRPASPA